MDTNLPVFRYIKWLADNLPWQWPEEVFDFLVLLLDGWPFVFPVALTIFVFRRTPGTKKSYTVASALFALLFYLRIDATFWKNGIIFGMNTATILHVATSCAALLIVIYITYQD